METIDHKLVVEASSGVPTRPVSVLRDVARTFPFRLRSLIAGFMLAWALFLPNAADAANSPPAMIVPGQFNVGATGAFSYTIPIAVPPGTGGMVPALSLDYSSQSGDGLEGLGWTLSGLPSIGRCPRTLAQDGIHGGVNYDSNDRFCLEGQRLVAISGTYGADGTVYRTEVEGFSKVVSHGSSGTGPAYFVVYTKAGQIMYFGYDEDSHNASNNSRLTLSTSNLTARAWAVEKIVDTTGNFLIVKYTNDMTNGQAYPNEIDYTGNDGASLTPFASVKFVYDNDITRIDVIPTYQAGYLMQTTHLLTNIRTYVGSTLVTNYELSYTLATSGLQHDELTSVKQCDAVTGGNCLKPTTFNWQGTQGTLTTSSLANGIAQGSSASDLGSITPGFWQGDGLTDVQTNSAASCGIYFATGSGSFSSISMLASYTQWYEEDGEFYHVEHTGPACAMTNIWARYRPFDFNGDGLTDMLINQQVGSATVNEFFLQNNGTQLNQVSVNSSLIPNLFGDFNGDGLSDYIAPSMAGADPNIFYSVGDGTFSYSPALTDTPLLTADFDGDGCTDLLYGGSTRTISYSCNPATPSYGIPDWSLDEVVVGDFNGDGKADILVAKAGGGAGTLYLSTGTGLVAQSFSVPTDWGKYQIVTGDWNGDGKTNIALIAAGLSGGYSVGQDHQVWLSTGTGFVEALTIDNSNAADTKEAAYTADWNNDGSDDIWIKKPSGDTEYFFGNGSSANYVPEVINSVTNGLGITTTISYDRINKNGIFYAKCSNGTYVCGDSYPTQDLDGPLYVVSEVDSSNGVGGTYSSVYSYGEAQANLTGRGFLGFGQVVIKDLQTGIIQTTNYETQFPYLGLIASQAKTCPAPTCTTAVTLNSTTNSFESVSLGTGTDGVARTFVGLTQSVVVANDLDGTALPATSTSYAYDCDSGGTSICAGTSPTGFGNATEVAACQWDTVHTECLTGGWSKTTTSTYTNDATSWHLGRLTAADVTSVVGTSTLMRQTAYGYDSSSGLLTSEIVEPESSSDPSLKLETDYGYDSFGNKTTATTKGCVWISSTSCSTTTPTASCATTTVFDTTTYNGQFATKITNALSQSETWNYDQGLGVPLNHTGPNGLETQWQYDTFGRKALEIRPDGNRTAIAYTYCTGLPAGESCPTNAQFDVIATPENSSAAQNGPVSVTYYDGLSRAIATDVEGFDASGTGCTLSAPCWIRVATPYDANGRVLETSRPYFLSGGTPKWTVPTYDTIGRVTKATFPDGSKTTYGFDGLTTTVTNDKSQTTTTVQNAEGLTASVEDANSQTTRYVYDAFGDLLTVTDPSSNVTTNTYDIRGRKTAAADPDMGSWAYSYDGFGELYSQTDAKGQVTTIAYDALGRVLTRTEPDLTSTWVYDTASGAGIGQLASATTGSGYTRTLTYDSLGRPSTVTLTIDGTAYVYHTVYNSDGRISTVDYPSGFTALYGYTTLGYAYQISDYGGSTVFWTANTRDAELHLLTQTAGNALVTTDSFDANTGRPISILAGASSSVSNQTFAFDTLGNLTSRSWLNNMGGSVTETSCYDNLNRLTGYKLTTSTTCPQSGGTTVAYDALGNITSKSDVCSAANCMSYTGPGPHAISAITGTYLGITNPVFTYDANGNMTCVSSGASCTGTVARTVTSTSFNMAATITEGGNSDAFTYDSEHSRIKQVATGANAGTTYYLNDPTSGTMAEKFVAGSASTWRDYIMADGHMVALRSLGNGAPPAWGGVTWGSFKWTAQSTTTPSVLYFTLDHLGSIAVVTDSTGAVVERDNYDPWGKRRNADGTAANCGTVASSTTRGFTGQEMMDSICLINFNARVYDPSLGRFMSADPMTETVYNLQILNRYSYVGNNPLSWTDPSGNCFLGCFWKQSWFKDIFAFAVIFVFQQYELLPAIGPFSAFVVNSFVGGFIAGGITGGSLTSAVLGGLQALAFATVAQTLGSNLGASFGGSQTAAYAGKFISSGLVGGLFSVAGGGNFGSGFLAAGVGSLAGALGGPFDTGKLIASSVLGGFASVLGGGKFANGAITGAFSYAAGSLGENDDQTGSSSSQGSANGIQQLYCQEYGCATSTITSQDTQVAEAACLYLSSQCNDLAPPTTRQDAIGRAEGAGAVVGIIGVAAGIDAVPLSAYAAAQAFRALTSSADNIDLPQAQTSAPAVIQEESQLPSDIQEIEPLIPRLPTTPPPTTVSPPPPYPKPPG